MTKPIKPKLASGARVQINQMEGLLRVGVRVDLLQGHDVID